MTRRVTVAAGSGPSFSLHPGGPKWTFRCGACSRTWRERIPMIDEPTLPCPTCGVLNTVPVVITQ